MKFSSFVIVLSFLAFNVSAQLKIEFPYDRMVFQRDNSNKGLISISGNSDLKLDKIEARLLPLKEGQGALLDWTQIATNVKYGDFTGELTHTGGWYALEIRGIKDNQIVSTTRLSHVGIGEVFVVAGQSNAQGFKRFFPKDAQDDRVNCLNYQKYYSIPETPEYKDFSHVDNNSAIAPLGDSPWAWGELGDKLAARLNVPILFFNCGYEGTNLNDWILSIKKIINYHSYYKFLFENYSPYSYLRIVLQNYCSRLGVRAVLWEQGEGDNNTPEDWYASNLKFMIDQTRTDTGKKLSWVVARTSLINTNQIYQNVINGQNKVINQADLIFPGPYTDSVQNPRPEGVHFTNLNGNDGISALATAWNKYLPNSFFQNSTPYTASKMVKLIASCDANNKLILKTDAAFDKYIWSSGENTSTVSASSGSYNLISRDASGNYYYSQNIPISKYLVEETPSIVAKSNVEFCDGNSVDLEIQNPSLNYAIEWNNASTNTKITVNNSGTFSARYKNSLSCYSQNSNILTTNKVDNPPKPLLSTNVSPLVCVGQSVQVNTTNQGANDVYWSTNQRESKITFSPVGEYHVSAYFKNSFGCQSPTSDTLNIGIKPIPSTPTITQNGPFALIANQLDAGAKLLWYRNDAQIANSNLAINATETGEYKVVAELSYEMNGLKLTCQSPKSPPYSFVIDPNHKQVIVFPNPVVENHFSVASEKELSQANLIIYDILGKEVLKSQIDLNFGPSLVNIETLERGIYFVKVMKDGEVWTTRIIVE